ncbi:MAG: hypothetical protein AAGA18_10725 [Verrucomicrobiota bacterium]
MESATNTIHILTPTGFTDITLSIIGRIIIHPEVRTSIVVTVI